jgi:hypothetical protein
MKKITYFIIGAFIGIVVCVAALYVSGLILESLGIQLYESESDQQRNFNIFLVLSSISALASGYFFAKKSS